MTNRKILIIDDEHDSLRTITATLDDAERQYTIVDSNTDGWAALEHDREFGLVLVRAFGERIRGLDLCRQIRQLQNSSDLRVVLILREPEVGHKTEGLLAGANDLLVDQFEPRELRMRAQIVSPGRVNRFDRPHSSAAEIPADAAGPDVFIPEFDPTTRRFDLGIFERNRGLWDNDPNVKKISLDKMIVCPECEAVPTVRPGCEACGSAWLEEEVLLHHYACAHVGLESEFVTPSGLVCPKCRLRDLVPGANFERTIGCLRCSDCAAVSAAPKLICHCLNCQERFPISEGKTKSVEGYQMGRSLDAAVIDPPTYHRAGNEFSANSVHKNS